MCTIQLVVNNIMIEQGSAPISIFTSSGIVLMSFILYYFPMVLFYSMFGSYIGRESNYGTRRNIIVSGYSKKQIFYSNTIFIIIVFTAILLFYQLIGFIISLIFNVGLTPTGAKNFIGIYLMNWLIIYVTIVFICTITMIVKSFGLSNMICIMVPIFFSLVIMFVVQFLPAIYPDSYDSNIKPVLELLYWYQSYAFSSANSCATNMSGETGAVDLINDGLYIKTIISSVILIAGQLFFGGLIFSKMDQK
jgi:ABC-type transport system involved in multi-copper enzyme maturation permease subunit